LVYLSRIYGRGYPKIELSYSSDFETGEVKVKAEQVQSKTENFCPQFDFILDVEVTDEAGTIHKMELDFTDTPLATTSCKIAEKTNPQMLRVDPGGKILFAWDKVEVPEKLLILNAKNGDDIFTRLWSYQELIKKGSPTAMEAVSVLFNWKVAVSILTEKFWGVRNFVASALAKSKTQSCVNILASMVEKETNALSLQSIIAGMGLRF
jgi:hypothetical protein